MPRRITSPRPVDLGEMTERVTLPPPARVPREAADAAAYDEHVDIERIATDPPPAPSEPPGSGQYAGASESLTPPTLAPPPPDRPFFHRQRVSKIALTALALVVVGALSYAMGRARGRTEGELVATHAQLSAIAAAVSASDSGEASPTPTASTRTSAAPAATTPLVAQPATSMAAAAPTAVESTTQAEPSEATPPAAAAPNPYLAEQPTETRAERRERRSVEAEARRERAARRQAARTEASATTRVTATSAREEASPTPAGVEAGPSEAPAAGQTSTAVATPPDGTTANEASAAEATAAQSEAEANPFARAIDADSAARLGSTFAPPAPEDPNLVRLPERPSRNDVRAAIHRILPQVRACGEGGTLTVAIRIQPDGHVANARIVQGSAVPAVSECIEETVMDARFPPFRGPELVVRYPFRL